MSSIFHRLHRIRKLEERQAKVALAEAHSVQESRQAEVVSLLEAMERSYASATSPALWATHHRRVMDHELARRRTEHQLEIDTQRVVDAHDEVVTRATSARTVELLATSFEERAEREARHAEQVMMDEVGAQQWVRRAS